MAAPTFVAATGMHDGLTTNIGTFTWTVPATAQAGDVAVLMVGMNAGAANPFLTPTGWTAIGTVLNTSGNHNTQAFGKVLTSSDPGATVTASLTTLPAGGKIHGGGIVIRGAEGIPSNFVNVTDTTTGATVAGPTITTDSADNLVVAIGMLRNTTATVQSTAAVSTGWTERTDTGTANSVAPNFTASIVTRNAVQATAGAVTGPTFTSTDTASTGHVWVFAFEPSTAPVAGSAPTYVVAAGAHDALTSNIDTFSWAIPPAAQAGDVAVIAVGMNTGSGVFPAPTGWTAIGAPLVTSANHTTQLFGKKLVAADLGGTVTTTVPIGAGKIHGGGIVVRGTNIPTEHFASATDTTTGATVTGPSITTDSGDNLIATVGMIRNTTTTSVKGTAAVSAGWTERTDTGTANAIAPNFTASWATRDAIAAAPGAVAGATFTSSDTASTGHVWAVAFEPVSNVPPTISAGPDQTVEPYTTVTLSFTGSGGDGTIVAYTVTQTDGAPVTLTAPTLNTRTFKAPGTIAGDILTFSVTATDDSGAMSAPDAVSITDLPVTERAAVGGAWVPLELRAF